MIVNDLSKELGVKNKDLITFLKENGFNISSHMQTLTNEMIDLAKSQMVIPVVEEALVKEDVVESKKNIDEEIPEIKKYDMDDLIPCRSVTPWELITVGTDKNKVYHWSGYGDVDYVRYGDLQSLRRKNIIKAPKIIIEDVSLCYQWRRELGDTYKHFLKVEYPEEFFDLPDAKFETLLKEAPDTLKEVIKVTAVNMIKNENYPSIMKLILIDNILGTCLKEFL